MKKTEEEKKMICEWLDRFVESIEKAQSNSISHLEQFKKDNDLLPVDKFNKWLIHSRDNNWLGKIDEENNLIGVNVLGEAMTVKVCSFNLHLYQLATPEQVEERLTKCALKMGYGKRQSECLEGLHNSECSEWINGEITFIFESHTNSLWVRGLNYFDFCIMKNGIWAKFLPTEIEKIEAKIKKLQAKLDGLK